MAYDFDKEIHLIDRFPDYFKETKEIVAACEALDPEFNLLLGRLKASLNNISILTADERGVKRYEQWVGIPTNPYLPLEERRMAVIAKLNETLPYTEIRLIKMLAAIAGWANFKYERHGAFVKVTLSNEAYYVINPVRDMLERILPMNLYYEVIFGAAEGLSMINFVSIYQETRIIETLINLDKETAVIYHGSPYLESATIETGIGE